MVIARRKLLIAFSLSLLSRSRLSAAQEQGRVRRIGFLAPLSRSTPSQPDVYYDAFVQGMGELGYIEGKNLAIEWRFADGKFERLPGLAAELIGMKVEVILTHSTPATRALQRATGTIPIVFAVAIDPAASGFAASLAKRLELLKNLVPALSRVAILVNPGTSVHPAIVRSVQAAGQQAGIEVLPVDAGTPEQIERGFATMTRERAEGAIVADDAFFRGQRRQIAHLALKNRMPAIAPWREYVATGGLMSYGQSISESFRRAATYVDRILKGAKPGDLPIEQPTRIHLAINRTSAKALGLAIPQELLLRADEVID